ncbi:MAG TPA: hypothetical protein VGR16_02055 [Thermomicrobiales bacterium]|nr:hypothetical protein [Thermomicrobiales bacterium]
MTITIISISRDEVVNSLGDGDAAVKATMDGGGQPGCAGKGMA